MSIEGNAAVLAGLTLPKVGTDPARSVLWWSCYRGASRIEAGEVAEWQISKIGKVGRYIGTVHAADADEAIRRAIEKYDIEPEKQSRIAARQIVVR